jgi:REP element-mobilizing transposase RayT
MPDHLHAVVVFPGDRAISDVVGDWKAFLSRVHLVRWQRDYFDHRLRHRKETDECWHYIRQNPVRAGLCANPEEWRWWSSPEDAMAPE